MSKIQKQIAELEAKAADSELIANLSTDPAVQARSLAEARRYRAQADRLRGRDVAEQRPTSSEPVRNLM